MEAAIRGALYKVVVLTVAVMLCLAGSGVAYGCWHHHLDVGVTCTTGLIGVEFVDYTCSDVPGEPDLGYTKDVGQCVCELRDTDGDGDYDLMEVNVSNSYASYQCLYSVTVGNNATVPVYIADTSLIFSSHPAALTLEGFWLESNMVGTELWPGDTVTGDFWLHVKDGVEQEATYTFRIRIQAVHDEYEPQDLGGTIGFWKNWDRHHTYTREQIEDWLEQIDADSCWLGPTTVCGMKATLRAACGGTSEKKFLGHYLATSLDAASGRLALTRTHDVTGLDEDNYLGLADPEEATLAEIIDAIEGKCGESPSWSEFEVMKDICDALNNLDI